MLTMISPIQDPVMTDMSAIAEYTAPDVPTTETATQSPKLTLPRETVVVNSWCPRYSPISMASSLGGDVRPTSSLPSSPQWGGGGGTGVP